jgi:hypothetical protein
LDDRSAPLIGYLSSSAVTIDKIAAFRCWGNFGQALTTLDSSACPETALLEL